MLPGSLGRPNFVVIVADDAGWGDVGFHGSEIQTPCLDRLARAGKELTQFHVEPVCSPTRASLMMGRPSSRFGISRPLQTYTSTGLPQQSVTLAECLRRAGYDTCIAGKWHLGMQPHQYPGHYGFRHSYGYVGPWIDAYTHLTTNFRGNDEAVRQWHRNGLLIDEQGPHVTDLITDEAIRFITDLRDPVKPFFLYVPYSAPHVPLQEDDRWVEIYRDHIPNKSRRLFAAAMTHLDNSVERIMTVLDRLGLSENTLLLFFSDNGGQRGEEVEARWLKPPARYNMMYGSTDALGNNQPLRGWKGQLYEGGIRVPALIHWSGRLKSGPVTAVLSVQDIYPTFAHCAGITDSSAIEVEGVNILPVLEGGELPGSRVIYLRLGSQCAVLHDGWKLLHFGEDPDEGRDELYNIENDPCEQSDLAGQYPGKVSELTEIMRMNYSLDR